MKRFIIVFLAVILCVGAVGCNDKESRRNRRNKSDDQSAYSSESSNSEEPDSQVVSEIESSSNEQQDNQPVSSVQESNGDDIELTSDFNDESQTQISDTSSVEPTEYHSPFYGIWVSASKDKSECDSIAADLQSKGFAAGVYETTDWSNLNTEHWYVVSAGEFESEGAAGYVMPNVQALGYEDAYVKYTGDWIR